MRRAALDIEAKISELSGTFAEDNSLGCGTRFRGVAIIEGEAACTGCTGELLGALSTIREAGYSHALLWY